MCGLIATFSKKGKKVCKSVMKKYKAQESRGTNGFGYVAVYKNKINVGRSTDEKGIRDQIMKETSGMIMFHHRKPTSTPNVIEATHPIFVSNEELDHDYFVVHNGVLSNETELKKVHEGLGYVYNTIIETETMTHYVSKHTGNKYFNSIAKVEKFNDSESLAIEVARMLDGMTRKIDAIGTIAFIAYKVSKEDGSIVSMHYGHNSGNPLTLIDNKDYFCLASVGGTDVPEDILYSLSLSGKTMGDLTEVAMPIGYTNSWKRDGFRYNDYGYSTQRSLPLPKEDKDDKKVGKEVKEYKKNSRGVYDSMEDYWEEKYGYSKTKRSDWDKQENRLQGVGFELNNGQDEDGNVDTTKELNFQEVSGRMAKEYLDTEEALNDIRADIDCAEFMLKDPNDTSSITMLKNEIASYEKKLNNVQEMLNDIEDRYYDTFDKPVSFKKLLDVYRQEREEMGVIQMDPAF